MRTTNTLAQNNKPQPWLLGQQNIDSGGSCGDVLVEVARPGDRIMVMGAGDDSLSQFAHELLQRLAGQAIR